jgi:hypothetical protein
MNNPNDDPTITSVSTRGLPTLLRLWQISRWRCWFLVHYTTILKGRAIETTGHMAVKYKSYGNKLIESAQKSIKDCQSGLCNMLLPLHLHLHLSAMEHNCSFGHICVLLTQGFWIGLISIRSRPAFPSTQCCRYHSGDHASELLLSLQFTLVNKSLYVLH